MVHSGYHPLRIVLGMWISSSKDSAWDGAQWISSSKDSTWDGAQWISSSKDSTWMVHSGYHPLRIVFGWCTVDIIL